jgi:hypothetical protein
MSLAIAAFAPPAPSLTKAAPASAEGGAGVGFATTMGEQTGLAQIAAPQPKKMSISPAQRGPAGDDAQASDATSLAPSPVISAAPASIDAPADTTPEMEAADTTEAEAMEPADVTTSPVPQLPVVAPAPSASPKSEGALEPQPSASDAGLGAAALEQLKPSVLPPPATPPASFPQEGQPAIAEQQNVASAPAPVAALGGAASSAAILAPPTIVDPATASSKLPTVATQAQSPRKEATVSQAAPVVEAAVAPQSAEPVIADGAPQTPPLIAAVLASGARTEAPASNAHQTGEAPSAAAPSSGDAAPKPTLAGAAPAQSDALVAADAPPASAPATTPAGPPEAPVSPPAAAAPAAPAPTPQTAAAAFPLGLMSTLSQATVETTTHLAAQIAARLEGRATRFDMVLTPEDLGRVEVSLEIDETGQLAARLAFDNPAAATDLRGRADELRRQLQDAGFQIAGDGLDFSHREDARGGETGGGLFDRRGRPSLFSGASRLAAEADIAAAPPPGAWINLSLARERVDLKV